jgi:hypothetical protein
MFEGCNAEQHPYDGLLVMQSSMQNPYGARSAEQVLNISTSFHHQLNWFI